MAEVQARDAMDQIIETIKQGQGRTSLHQADDPLVTMPVEITSDKPQALEKLLDLMDIGAVKVAHENHQKYILLRDGTTSFVYLGGQ